MQIFNKLSEIIENVVGSSDITLSEYELELRLGYLNYKNKFIPNIGKENFEKIFNYIAKQNVEVVENAFINDKIYENGICRRTKRVSEYKFQTKNYQIYDTDDTVITSFINKEKINQYTYDFIRLNFNKEINLETLNMSGHPKFERQKYRVSALYNNIFRFDFTIVNDLEYSLEIEILLPNILKNTFQTDMNNFIDIFKPIMNIFEKNIIDTITPPQPHTMSYSDLFIIASSNYTVTDKADGVRTFLKIKNNNVELFNPKTKQVIRDLGEYKYKNTLIDGEYVNNRFYAFDIMFYKNEDVRNKNLLERLNLLKIVTEELKLGLYIKMKKFYSTNIFENAKNILNQRHSYRIDGLIFTPIYQEYNGEDLSIFKWKMRQTIDVRVKYMKKDNFTYFIYGKRFGRINEWSDEYFERKNIRTRDERMKKMYNTFHNQEYETLTTKKIHFGKYKHFNSTLFNTPFLGKPGEPNRDHKTNRILNKDIDIILDKYDIIEYEYRNGEWFPLRKRTFDKDEANAIKTIGSVLKVIEEDITINTMLEFEKKYHIKSEEKKEETNMYNEVAQDKAFKRENWRKFHNYIKRKLIINASNSCVGGSYLDLACGKGGDLQKYLNLGYKNILAIDSSEIELYGQNGYIHRLCKFGFVDKGYYYENSQGIKVTVICGDISKRIKTGEFMKNINDKDKLNNFFTRSNDGFDCISIMFAIHYMFGYFDKDKNWIINETKIDGFFNNIQELLKLNGKFIGTYLNMMDDNDHIFKNHGIPFYQIINKEHYLEIKNDVWGWEKTLTEPKINKNIFNSYLNKFNFVEVVNNSFEKLYQQFQLNEGIELTIDEQKLGFMNNFFMVIQSPKYMNKSISL